jgi:arylsulfatase A-like enzyme
MANFKYKLKEESQILKPKDVDPALIQRLEKQYGPVDIKNDFFSKNLDTYFKTSSIDKETGSVGHTVIKLSSFADSLEKLHTATEALFDLVKAPGGKDDTIVVKMYDDVKTLFNRYRTHLRKYYPDQYAAIKDKLNEMSTIASNSGFTSGGQGENHNGPSPRKSTYGAYTQAGWKKVNEGPGATMGPGEPAGPEGVIKNKYVTDFKYKLVNQKALNKKAKGIIVKQLWEAEDVEQFLDDMQINDPDRRKFVKERIMAFDAIEDKLNQLVPMLQQAKNKTIDYYRNKPESYAVVYGTDLAQEYLDDLINLFNEQQ